MTYNWYIPNVHDVARHSLNVLFAQNKTTRLPHCADLRSLHGGEDLDDLEDTTADGLSTLTEYNSNDNWRFNQDGGRVDLL